MKLSAWAKQQGLAYKTAWRMWKAGKLPVPAEQLPTGTIIVHPPVRPGDNGAVLYAGVSRHEQKADLDRQVARLSKFAAAQQYVEAALHAQGRTIAVVEPKEMTDDLVQDLHDVIVSLCSRLYGKRSAKNRAKRALEAATRPS